MRPGLLNLSTAGRTVVLLLGVLILAPSLCLLIAGLTPHTLEQAENWQHVQRHLLLPAIQDTLILCGGAMLVALLLGLPPAWVISQQHFRGRNLVGTLLVLPLAIPAYILSFLVTDLREALVPLLLTIRERWGMDTYLLAEEWSRYGMLILVFGAVLYPYVFLAARSAFSGNLRGLSEASRSLQCGAWRTFWRVQLPLARPAIITSLFFVAMEVLNDYGAVKHFGFSTFTVTLFRTWFGLNDLAAAQRLACWLLGGVLLIMWLERLQRGRRRFTQEKQAQPHPYRERLTPLAIIAISAPLLLGLLGPLYLLTRWILMSLETLDATVWSSLGHALLNSLKLGLIVVSITVLAALIIVGTVRYTRHRLFTSGKDILQIVGYASPGVIMAIGVLSVVQPIRDSGSFTSFNTLTSATILLLTIALTCRYYSVASQMVSQALERLPHSYDEASHSLGRTTFYGYLRTVVPLITPALLGASALVFVDVTKELPLCLLLRPFDFETLGTYTYSFVDQGQLYHSALPSALLILLCMAGLLAVELGGWRKK